MAELGGYSGTGSGGPAGEHQEDKERTIAKAALSVAELSACGMFFFVEVGCVDGMQVHCLMDPTKMNWRRYTRIRMASRRF